MPHLLCPIVSQTEEFIDILNWLDHELNRRYRTLELQKCRKLSEYNSNFPENQIPYIVIIIDEFLEFIYNLKFRTQKQPKEFSLLVRILKKSRAAGIHFIVSISAPRSKVISGELKENFDSRISLQVADRVISQIILDEIGAERLQPHGDMLVKDNQNIKPVRIHGPLITNENIEKIVQHWKSQF